MSVIKTYAVQNPDATGGGLTLNVDGTVEIDGSAVASERDVYARVFMLMGA